MKGPPDPALGLPGPMPGTYPQGPQQYGPAPVYPQDGFSLPVNCPVPQPQDGILFPQPVSPASPSGLPSDKIPPQDQALTPTGTNSLARLLDHLEVSGLARGFYRNDQRIEWSGMEATFGARGPSPQGFTALG